MQGGDTRYGIGGHGGHQAPKSPPAPLGSLGWAQRWRQHEGSRTDSDTDRRAAVPARGGHRCRRTVMVTRRRRGGGLHSLLRRVVPSAADVPGDSGERTVVSVSPVSLASL